MTQGRLYKSARATGPMADDAILALPERQQLPAKDSAAPAAPSAIAEASPASPSQMQIPAVESGRPSLTDFDHIFAEDDLSLVDDDELFPWAADNEANSGAAALPSAAPVVSTPSSTPLRTFTPPESIKVERPLGLAEGRNNPVVTYLSRQPKIRLTFTGAIALLIGVTLICGLLEAIVSQHIGLFTAVLSLLAGLATTWFVSDSDRTAPSLGFPVAWLVTALIAGQFTAPPSGSLALKQVVVVLGVLGDNALVIILGTIACYALARLRPRLVTDLLA